VEQLNLVSLGTYNKKVGITPFERFQVGGNGIPSNVTLFGTDIIAHRGFEGDYSTSGGDPIYNKFLLELRYPFSLNPSATIYGLVFFEAANTYATFKDYNPFKLKEKCRYWCSCHFTNVWFNWYRLWHTF
jgi:outer membrane protein insertion porin family